MELAAMSRRRSGASRRWLLTRWSPRDDVLVIRCDHITSGVVPVRCLSHNAARDIRRQRCCQQPSPSPPCCEASESSSMLYSVWLTGFGSTLRSTNGSG